MVNTNSRLIAFKQYSIGIGNKTARNVYDIREFVQQKHIELLPPHLDFFRVECISQWCQCRYDRVYTTIHQFVVQVVEILLHFNEITSV